jgi:hypothetical protein
MTLYTIKTRPAAAFLMVGREYADEGKPEKRA